MATRMVLLYLLLSVCTQRGNSNDLLPTYGGYFQKEQTITIQESFWSVITHVSLREAIEKIHLIEAHIKSAEDLIVHSAEGKMFSPIEQAYDQSVHWELEKLLNITSNLRSQYFDLILPFNRESRPNVD